MIRSIVMPAPFVLIEGNSPDDLSLEEKLNNALHLVEEDLTEGEQIVNCQLIETTGQPWRTTQCRFYLVVFVSGSQPQGLRPSVSQETSGSAEQSWQDCLRAAAHTCGVIHDRFPCDCNSDDNWCSGSCLPVQASVTRSAIEDLMDRLMDLKETIG